MTWTKKERIYEVNKGKKCKTKDCNSIAKTKGYCIKCYNRNLWLKKRNGKK